MLTKILLCDIVSRTHLQLQRNCQSTFSNLFSSHGNLHFRLHDLKRGHRIMSDAPSDTYLAKMYGTKDSMLLNPTGQNLSSNLTSICAVLAIASLTFNRIFKKKTNPRTVFWGLFRPQRPKCVHSQKRQFNPPFIIISDRFAYIFILLSCTKSLE